MKSATTWTPIATADVTKARSTATITSHDPSHALDDSPPPELIHPLMANIPSQSAVETKSNGMMLDENRTAPVNTSTIPIVEIEEREDPVAVEADQQDARTQRQDVRDGVDVSPEPSSSLRQEVAPRERRRDLHVVPHEPPGHPLTTAMCPKTRSSDANIS